MTLFVSNLHFDLVDETALRELFSNYGQVVRVFLARDHATDKSRGFAFVDMATDEDAVRATLELNKTKLHGRTLFVSEGTRQHESQR